MDSKPKRLVKVASGSDKEFFFRGGRGNIVISNTY